MENQEVYNIGDGTKEITIIHKKGLNAEAPIPTVIVGNIDSAHKWLQHRYFDDSDGSYPVAQEEGKLITAITSHVLINREEMSIELVVNEHHPFLMGSISGKLVEHPDFAKWNINTGEDWNHDNLAEFIKMNRSCFTSKDVAMKLSTELKSLKVKVDKEVEASNDNRGSFKAMLAQKVVDLSIPSKFNLLIPVFKGQDKVEFEVEIYVNPNTFRVTLVSPDASDIISSVRDNIIDEQKKEIEELAPDLVIIEQ